RTYLLNPERGIDAALIAPFFVPESIPLDELLSQFQKNGKRAAIVVDEYGGTAGLVTRGDILEEISGDIYQELSKPRPIFQEAGPHRWLVDANISLDEINRKLRLELHAEDADRLSGWLAERLEHIPEPNETVVAPDCRVTVLQTNKRRVTLAMIEKGLPS
ncbi:MAG: transporter associated domain-containing protein, partial [Kiritimatiellia bacterium]|nr:transporter associated domain-containing protein [Kiritimatiellia bacterium]